MLIQFQSDETLKTKLEKEAKAKGLSLSAFIRVTLNEALPKTNSNKETSVGEYRKGLGYLHSDSGYYSVPESVAKLEKEIEQANPDESPFKALLKNQE